MRAFCILAVIFISKRLFPWYIFCPWTTNIFLRGLKIFFISCSQGLRKSQISWDHVYWGDLIFFLGEGGAGPFSSMKPSMTNHVNSRIVDGKMFPITFCFYIIVMCMLTFLTLKLVSSVFYFLSNFYFSSNDRPSKTMKNVFYFI